MPVPRRFMPILATAALVGAALPDAPAALRGTPAPFPATLPPPPAEPRVMARASGTFEVKLTPLSSREAEGGIALGRSAIEKRFHGDLQGTGEGEMLTTLTPVSGSAAYVAIERVAGTVHGRTGSFVLQHRGVMTRGEQDLAITVVPDSGTGELAGIVGTMTIAIAEGTHSYELEYTLGEEG